MTRKNVTEDRWHLQYSLVLAWVLTLFAGVSVGAEQAVTVQPAAAAVTSSSPPLVKPAAAAPTVAQTLLQRMQARYQAPQSLRLDFRETYTNQATGRRITDSGTLFARRPGEMRWEYSEPSNKLFVMSGGEAWFYVPEELIAYRLTTSGEGSRRLPILFLSGQGDLLKLFEPSLEGTEGTRLRLRGRDGEDEFDHLLIELDPDSVAVKSMSVVDVLGNTTEFLFTNERLNPKVESRLFRFTPPDGVDIVDPDR